MSSPLRLSLEERDRIVAEAKRMRSEAIADLFRSAGRGLARLFGAPGRAIRHIGPSRAGERPKASSA
jgi:hypothetical protein